MQTSTEEQGGEADRYKDFVAKLNSAQLEERLSQLEAKGITEGAEVTAIRKGLKEREKPENIAADTRDAVADAGKKERGWDRDWADKLKGQSR